MILDGHPLLILAVGIFAAPLLLRQLQFSQWQRSWWVLPLLGFLPGLAIFLVEQFFPLEPGQGLNVLLDLELRLLAAFLSLVLLNWFLDGRDRELIELSLTLPGVLFLPLYLKTLLPPDLAFVELIAGSLGGLLLLILVFLLTGLQERFRRNPAPGALEGLPFRLAILSLLLFIVVGIETLLGGRLQ
jgi:hypothetical protein